MRVFMRLREMTVSHKELAGRLESLENMYAAHVKVAEDAIRDIVEPLKAPKRQIGFEK